jgi:murein L,D-transpeptidase YafK
VEGTIADSRASGGTAIVVSKEQHLLQLYRGGRLVRSYRAEMGYNAVHTKLRAGDGSTPEGRYRITAKKGAGQSTYYKALLLNYPNEEDRQRFERARRAGSVPRGASPGGLIEIHGEGGRGKDWTKGCVALTNGDIDDLFARVGIGTPVTIVGSDGRGGIFTDMAREHGSARAAVAGKR